MEVVLIDNLPQDVIILILKRNSTLAVTLYRVNKHLKHAVEAYILLLAKQPLDLHQQNVRV